MKKNGKEKVFEIGGAKVIICPNEIWIMPADSVPWVKASKYGFRISPCGLGPHGFAIEVASFVGRRPITVFGNGAGGYEPFPPKGEQAPDLLMLELVQYDTTLEASQFRAWYEGRGPYPAEPQEEK
jgi:hypothetical protein